MYWLIVPSIAGALVGAALLRMTSPALFDRLVPLLILFATLLFAAQERVQRFLNIAPEHHGSLWFAAAIGFQFLVSVYGGYFGAGMGILMLVPLAILGHDDIHQMNRLKNLLGGFIYAVADSRRPGPLMRAGGGRRGPSPPLPFWEARLRPLGGLTERVSLDEVTDISLPLSRLLNLYVGATQKLHAATSTFLGGSANLRIPFVIGIAGSVAVGKSTASRVLKTLLSDWPHHPPADLGTTAGFPPPQRELEGRRLAQ